jgi:chromosome segregation ATPase
MPRQGTRTVHFAAVGPSPSTNPVLPTKNHPSIPRGVIQPPFSQQSTQHAKGRLEIILAQIYAEYIGLQGRNDEIRDMLQKEKWEKEELQGHIRKERREMERLQRHIQAAEERAWGYEKQVNQLTVQLDSRKATPLTDQQEQH